MGAGGAGDAGCFADVAAIERRDEGTPHCDQHLPRNVIGILLAIHHRLVVGEDGIAAFENADPAALERLLCQDATLEAPPLRTWYAGIRYCMPYMAARVLGSPGHWRMLPTHANGHPAVAAYTRTSDGSYQPYGIVVLDTRQQGIARITAFGDPALIAAFGLPMQPPVP